MSLGTNRALTLAFSLALAGAMLTACRHQPQTAGDKDDAGVVEIATPYGTLAVPRPEVERIVYGKTGTAAEVELAGGDRLSGQIRIVQPEPPPLAAPVKLENGLVFHLSEQSVDGSSTVVKDLSRYDHDGRFVAGPTAADGLSFNGDGAHVVVPAKGLLSFGDGMSDSPLTVAATMEVHHTGTSQTILSKYNSFVNPRQQEYVFCLDGKGRLQVTLFQTDRDFRLSVATTEPIPTGWRRLCVAYDGSASYKGIAMYVDGAAMDTTVIMIHPDYRAMRPTPAPLMVGAAVYSSSRLPNDFLTGRIADLRLYNRRLSMAEITALAEVPPPE